MSSQDISKAQDEIQRGFTRGFTNGPVASSYELAPASSCVAAPWNVQQSADGKALCMPSDFIINAAFRPEASSVPPLPAPVATTTDAEEPSETAIAEVSSPARPVKVFDLVLATKACCTSMHVSIASLADKFTAALREARTLLLASHPVNHKEYLGPLWQIYMLGNLWLGVESGSVSLEDEAALKYVPTPSQMDFDTYAQDKVDSIEDESEKRQWTRACVKN